MMRQAIALFPAKSDKPVVLPALPTFEKGMTIKGKKNSKVKIIANRKKHNYWSNIFRRKRIMSEYFSDSAFGSQSDTKIELHNTWEDEKSVMKYRSMRIIEYQYDENEMLPTQGEEGQRPTTMSIAFMHDPNEYKEIKEKKTGTGQEQQ